MFGIFGTLKTYALIGVGGLTIALMAALKFMSRKINKLEQSAAIKNLESRIYQKTIVEAAEAARLKAEKEGQKRVDDDIESAKRGIRRRFD